MLQLSKLHPHVAYCESFRYGEKVTAHHVVGLTQFPQNLSLSHFGYSVKGRVQRVSFHECTVLSSHFTELCLTSTSARMEFFSQSLSLFCWIAQIVERMTRLSERAVLLGAEVVS